MSMQDPISDMLTRLRNGCMSMQKQVVMPSSAMKAAIAQVLKDEGYIADFAVEGDVKKVLKIQMKYLKQLIRLLNKLAWNILMKQQLQHLQHQCRGEEFLVNRIYLIKEF